MTKEADHSMLCLWIGREQVGIQISGNSFAQLHYLICATGKRSGVGESNNFCKYLSLSWP